MVKKVEIELSKEELIEIIAYYVGVKKEDVDLLADFNGNICCIVKKELAFPEEKQTVIAPTDPYSPWMVRPDTANPLSPYVTWTSDAKCITNTGTEDNITSTGTSISEESIRKSIDDIRAKWTKDDALTTSETSKANDWK